ncbi:MAG: hypothetical protein WA430_12525, partial [Acidobacteriaceae bacterium]
RADMTFRSAAILGDLRIAEIQICSLTNRRANLGKLELTQPLLRRNLFASVNAQYTSGMTTFYGGSVSPYSIVNFDRFGRRIGRHFDLSPSLYNLLNKTDYDPPSTAVPEAAIQQDGPTFRTKMTWHQGER